MLAGFSVQDTRSDLVVLGTHGRRGLDWLLLDSNAEQVARIAPVLVMLVRDKRATAEPGVVSQAVRDASSIP